ncbi:hypothetical protein GCM10028801_44870 [Nocardioides maradonensis]
MKTTRNAALDRLALGSNCPECGATPDESCRTRRANNATNPHSRRIDRACNAYEATAARAGRIDVRKSEEGTR